MVAAVLSLSLAGGVDGFPDRQVAKGDVRNAVARAQISPRGATVALVSLDGAPSSVTDRFRLAFAKEAADREITMADQASAHYLVRGYLSAGTSDTGADITFVYDIFDANDGSRFDRVADDMSVPGVAGDAWASVDDRVVASLATRSADALASALASTPAARAAIAPTQTAAATPPPADAIGGN